MDPRTTREQRVGHSDQDERDDAPEMKRRERFRRPSSQRNTMAISIRRALLMLLICLVCMLCAKMLSGM